MCHIKAIGDLGEYERTVTAMSEENIQMSCTPNYEAYYEEYRDKYNCMYEKVCYLEKKLKEEHNRNMILEAQMEVVRLIFGLRCEDGRC